MKALIIEDEELVAEDLQNSIAAVAGDIEVLAVLPSLKAARKWLMQHAEPELLFMDVRLSDGLSFELFEQFELKCPVIFCTAYEEYAIRAFKVSSVDYLLKPVQEDDLKKAIGKCRAPDRQPPLPGSLQQLLQQFVQPSPQPIYKERFIVEFNNKWMPVQTKDIAAIVKDELNYIYTFGGDRLIYDFSAMEDIEQLLDPKYFFRANRQTIIHVSSVHTVRQEGNQKLNVQLRPPLKLQVDISREKAPAFRKWMDK